MQHDSPTPEMPDAEIPNSQSDTSAACKHEEVCARTEHKPGLGYCILHDPDMEKDREAFDTALAEHRAMLEERREKAKREEGDEYKPRGELADDFRWMVFPDGVSFSGETFPEEGVDFFRSTFGDEADFSEATFSDGANFVTSTFGDEADFRRATFGDGSDFIGATFGNGSDFSGATFGDDVNFIRSTFGNGSDFLGATFGDGSDFLEATFSDGSDFRDSTFGDGSTFVEVTFGDGISFSYSLFIGECRFVGTRERLLFTSDQGKPCRISFKDASFRDTSKVLFQNVDLSRTLLLPLDAREVEFTNVVWANIEGVNGVYDEQERQTSEDSFPYAALAKLYRRLKQNYEENRDYGRGGDFHFREKEMMRRNPATPLRDRIVLSIYRAVSGYGERYWAGGWFIALIVAYAFAGLLLGIEKKVGDGWEKLLGDPSNLADSLSQSLLHSLQVVFLRSPSLTRPETIAGDFVQILVMILGPILLGLFGLAVRQRMRR